MNKMTLLSIRAKRKHFSTHLHLSFLLFPLIPILTNNRIIQLSLANRSLSQRELFLYHLFPSTNKGCSSYNGQELKFLGVFHAFILRLRFVIMISFACITVALEFFNSNPLINITSQFVWRSKREGHGSNQWGNMPPPPPLNIPLIKF